MNDREIAETGKELARKIISLNQVCDKSKMDDIELERLNDLVEHARTMFVDPGEYDSSQDDPSFGC